MNFRAYKTEETHTIAQMFEQTFTDSEGAEEGKVIGELARNLMAEVPEEDLLVYVAEEDEAIAGGIIFSRFRFENVDLPAFLLAPVAIHTHFQSKGLGQELIRFGLSQLKSLGVALVFTYGDINFYSRTGFQQIKEAQIKAPLPLTYPEGWMALHLKEEPIPNIAGNTICVSPIAKPGYW